MKAVSVMLAVLFALSAGMVAFAEEPADSYAGAPVVLGDEVLGGFDIIASLQDVAQKKDEFQIEASNVKADSAVLKWKNDGLCMSYRICRYNLLTKKWDELTTVPQNKLRLTDLKSNTPYKYCVINDTSGRLLGVEEFRTRVKKPKLSVKEINGDSVKLAVKNVPQNARVQVYRKASDGKFKKLATLKKGKKTYTDKNLKAATPYTYKVKTVVTTKENGKKVTKTSAFSKAQKVTTLLSMGLPSVSGKTKTYAIYTAVTARSSPQYKLLHSDKCYTDEETGIRMVDGCYCVALGSYYGTKIGTKYRITFSTGTKIDVILCDQKADRHTDSRHQYAVNNSDIVEFYVERAKMPSIIRNRGNYGILEKFSGSVVAIEKYI